MARLKKMNTADRRASCRVPASKVVPHETARLASGQQVTLVNISSTGAILIHSKVMLAPGAYVRLRLNIPGNSVDLNGIVRRCRIIGLKQEKIKFEAAVVPDEGLPPQLAERLQSLENEDSRPEAACLKKLNACARSVPETADLWILSPQEN